MKPSRKIFFAIPFDSATRSMYERVARQIREHFTGVTTVIGSAEVGPSPRYSKMASFRAQNRELQSQFVAQIRDADVVVADLTHNNPNVHVELGIALMENKNILRVTGRAVTELGFDIRNLDVCQYKREEELAETLRKYLDMFFEIKQLTISPEHGNLYFREPAPLPLEGILYQDGILMGSSVPSSYLLRDGAVKATFEILKAKSDNDWFGVCFRYHAPPSLGSYLVYVRKKGTVELAQYTHRGTVVIEAFPLAQEISGKQTLTIEFENEYLEVQIGQERFTSTKLSHQTVGGMAFAACDTDVIVHSAEMIRRDTIDWN